MVLISIIWLRASIDAEAGVFPPFRKKPCEEQTNKQPVAEKVGEWWKKGAPKSKPSCIYIPPGTDRKQHWRRILLTMQFSDEVFLVYCLSSSSSSRHDCAQVTSARWRRIQTKGAVRWTTEHSLAVAFSSFSFEWSSRQQLELKQAPLPNWHREETLTANSSSTKRSIVVVVVVATWFCVGLQAFRFRRRYWIQTKGAVRWTASTGRCFRFFWVEQAQAAAGECKAKLQPPNRAAVRLEFALLSSFVSMLISLCELRYRIHSIQKSIARVPSCPSFAGHC